MSNRDKRYTPQQRTVRSGSAGADILARASAQKTAENRQQRLTDVMPSPVPFDTAELSSGREFRYEWEEWVASLQQQIDDLAAAGSGGGGGGSVVYVHTQAFAASVWTINHGLGTKPNVLVVDGSGQQLIPEVHFPSNSQVTLSHAVPYTGTAFLRA